MADPTATNPETGERLVFRNGAWIPLEENAPEVAPTATNAQGQTVVLENGQWIPLGEAGDNGIYPQIRDTGLRADPASEAITVEPTPMGEDIARSLGSGLIKGVTGLAGLPAAARDLAHGAAEWQRENIWRRLGIEPENYKIPGVEQVSEFISQAPRALPSTQQIDAGVQGQIGQYYEPKSVPGEYAETIGEFAPGAAVPGGLGTRAASWLIPAVASESAGQVGRAIDESANQRNLADLVAGEEQPKSNLEPWFRLGGGLAGGLGTGLAANVRSGATNVAGNAGRGVTQQQLDLAGALRSRSPVPLTNAEALQQVTGGATGFGRVQRVVEGSSSRLAPMMAERPERVQSAIGNVLDQIGPEAAPQQVAGQAQEAATGVLDQMRRRVNESAQPMYDQLPGQTLDPAAMATLNANPSYARAAQELQGNPELAALLAGGQDDLSTVNRVIQQLDTLESQARPSVMNPQGNNTLASQRSQAAQQARDLSAQASPDFAAARQTVATGREAFVDPLRRGPIGAMAGQSEVQPNLSGQTNALFPSAPFEGQAQETSQALRLLGEIDPSVSPALVRQYLARQAAEATQGNISGANQFGGAKFAAQTFGNPLQGETVMGAVDTVAPMAARDTRDLVEALMATGMREPPGSQTAFNTQMMGDLRGGNIGQSAAASLSNPAGIPGRIGRSLDDWVTRRNSEKLAELLLADPQDFSAAVMRSANRPRGGNRIRLATLLSSQQEEE